MRLPSVQDWGWKFTQPHPPDLPIGPQLEASVGRVISQVEVRPIEIVTITSERSRWLFRPGFPGQPGATGPVYWYQRMPLSEGGRTSGELRRGRLSDVRWMPMRRMALVEVDLANVGIVRRVRVLPGIGPISGFGIASGPIEAPSSGLETVDWTDHRHLTPDLWAEQRGSRSGDRPWLRLVPGPFDGRSEIGVVHAEVFANGSFDEACSFEAPRRATPSAVLDLAFAALSSYDSDYEEWG